MAQHSPNIVILASGGIDSTGLIPYYFTLEYEPSLLWVDYGQPAAMPELQAVTVIAKYFSTPLRVVKISGIDWTVDIELGNDEFIGRNSLLTSVAVSSFTGKAGLIAMGIHSGTPYSDCSSEFLSAMSAVSTIVSNGRVDLDFPFMDWTKRDILAYCTQNNVPLDLTYSCLVGTVPPCGICSSCQDRNQLGI